MKLKNSYFYTLRENVKDEDSVSGNLLVRSGMIKKNSSGIYMYLPLGYRVLKKIEKLVRDAMDEAGAQEVLMPALIPEEVYVQSGRRELIGSSMFSLKDRFDKPFVLGPTHEELFLMAAQAHVKSYKDLPFNIYQFQTKFRDEPRPRFGLIRVREFIMKDAYSFDTDREGLDISYQKMHDAYVQAFDKMELDYKIVEADTGVMGGLKSEEFQALAPLGEDTLVLCDHCDFSSNLEVVACHNDIVESSEEMRPLEVIETPDAGKIKDLCDKYNLELDHLTKSMIYKADGRLILVMVMGEDEINELKLKKALDVKNLELADNEAVEALTHAKIGFAGPIGLDIEVIADFRIKGLRNFLVGANETDKHYINVNHGRDFKLENYADIRTIKEGETCPQCHEGKVHFAKGIEIGNIFKLGEKYSEMMGLNYLDQNNQLKPVVMGSYGIGLGRCMAAIAEQHHDDQGLIWPKNIAPYQVALVVINTKVDEQVEAGDKLYAAFKNAGIDVILDDRNERPGVKFNDMDLIGIPYRITLGKSLSEGQVELKNRATGEVSLVSVDEIVNTIQNELKA